jgi:asparagine synthase (glutamine-hydrolysing)
MCGIAGLVDPSSAARTSMSMMLDRLSHRGPDDGGIWSDPETGMTLGHRRLSIVDLSAAGHQPMVSASGRLVLSYNGEIYNHGDLRAELERAGNAPAWRGHSDTEVLLAGFEAWGIDATLGRCNGMFALALWDTHRRTLTLARDRMGEKPLYFGWVGGQFAFASELKAMWRLPGWSPRMDDESIASFLTSGYVRGPHSAVEGIYRLPPGCHLSLDLDRLRQPCDWEQLVPGLRHYWSLPVVAAQGLATPVHGIDEAMDAFECLLRDAVAIRMAADVPLGAFLSGGIDSSLVTALMQAQSTRPVRTFSIGFDSADFDEAPHASAIASHLGTAHTELYVGAGDALALVPQLAETFDEPFADHSQIPTMLVSALARRQVTVALSGDGGDELFAGYGRYFAIERLWRLLGPMPRLARSGAAPLLAATARALGPFRQSRAADAPLSLRLNRLAQRMRAKDVDALRLAFISGAGAVEIASRIAHPRDLRHCIASPHIGGTLRRLMFGDQADYLPDDILHKVDRASMAYGLEARVPLLDHRVVELSWRLPDQLLASRGVGKLVLRRLLERLVPRTLFDRPKQGFAPPMGQWLRGPLRDWAESMLAPEALRELPMLDSRRVRSLWAAHLNGRVDAGQPLWVVLMLADWRRRIGAGT